MKNFFDLKVGFVELNLQSVASSVVAVAGAMLCVVVMLAACAEQTPEEQATQAAKACYDRLLQGDTTALFHEKTVADSLPEDYKAWLRKAHSQYIADIRQKHGGLYAVGVSSNPARRDSTLNVVYTFLLLSFNDSTHEEICVPMVLKDGEWRPK